ncbi:MinD/ParA family protein [Paenibacillus sp. PK4536]|jgi:flagellar biosynthesis protein FlhG|uniref:Iron-sulfur cluster carrier protein n=1 Tax=Paenibacillus nuruki TaxID=1886670 RepID=A0A1E3L6Q1_9BACL|nr:MULTISPECIES: MinD/ParA family protein [Paenibacillus]ODP28650.1 Iron-sulfur cluster carrier protein [Paenibacillus nuruki]TKJ91566.1 MinD/ParA family protein [Paenibacillus sp. CFBP13512]WIM37797.1 MinD/ParA family protein [Paenibacillus sp. PK4536]CAJ1315555.1 Iron-sulfur cluster carrier protein [Paenibacillus nuruki]
MMDQAQSLRNLMSSKTVQAPKSEPRSAKFITITSGKGGVGKSNFTLNFALALQRLGRKVLVFDADIGMANIDVLMGVRSKFNLSHLLSGEKQINEIIEKGAGSLPYIAGGSGLTSLFSLSDKDLIYFTDQIQKVATDMDYILFDTGAGLSKETLQFIMSADECIVVTTPEPTSITDAYALIKVVHGMEEDVSFKLVVNRAESEKEAVQTSDKIRLVTSRFLNLEIPLLGFVSDDSHVSQSVKKQVPFSIYSPGCIASKDIQNLAQRYMVAPNASPEGTLTGIKGFMQKWLKRTK